MTQHTSERENDGVLVPVGPQHHALVDEGDYDLVMRAGPWSLHERRGLLYARQQTRRGGARMHKLLTGWALTDHINGDGLDNRRANLRPATVGQNNMNRSLFRSSTSGFKGVSLRKDRGTPAWRAYIHANRRRIDLGTFQTAMQAARAYDVAAVEIHGEFARLNFPTEAAR